MSAPTRPGLAPLALAGAGAAALVSVTAVVSAVRGPVSQTSDFAAFWRAGRWLTTGRVGSLYPSASFGGPGRAATDGTFKGFLNPPHTAVLWAPFAHVGLRGASLAFAALNAVALALLCVLTWRFLTRQGWNRVARATALLLAIACPGVATSVVNGTMSLLIVLAIAGVLFLDRNGDAWRTGIPLAVLAWKPQYAVLPVVFLLVRRHVRAVAGAAVVTLVSITATLPFTGIGPWRAYLPFLDRYAATLDIWDLSDREQLWLPRQMLNVRGLLVRALGTGAVGLINALSVAAIVLGVVTVVAVARRTTVATPPAKTATAWAAVLALTVVTSQHTNVSDGMILLVAAALLGVRQAGSGRGCVNGVLWGFAALDLAMLLGNPSGTTPLVPWSALAALVLACVTVRAALANGDARRPKRLKPMARRVDARPVSNAVPPPAAPVESAALESAVSSVSVGRNALLEPFLLATLAIAMTVMPYVVVGRGPDAWQTSASLSFADLIALLLAGVSAPAFVARLRSREVPRLIWGGLGVAAVLAATTAVHLSPRGVVLCTRLLVCVVLADLVARTGDRRREVLLRWLAIAAIFQCVVAVAQRVTRHAVGLAFLGEPLYPFRSGYPVPAGTMRDAYPLAAIGLFVAALHAVVLVHRRPQSTGARRLSAAAIVAGGVLAGLSGSRAAVLTIALVFVALLASGRGRGLAVGVLLLIGFASSALPSKELWLGRVATVEATGGGVDASNGRSALVDQALKIIGRNPLVGVGPGNYSEALERIPELAEKTSAYGVLPVHDMPLLAVAESGVLIVAPLGFVAVCLLALGLRRRGRWSPLLLAIVPYLLLDLVFWFYPEGLFMVAIAIGFTIAGTSDRAATKGVAAEASRTVPDRPDAEGPIERAPGDPLGDELEALELLYGSPRRTSTLRSPD